MKVITKINKWVSFRVKSKANGTVSIKKVGQRLGTIAIVTDTDKLVAAYEISLERDLRPRIVKL